MTNTEDRLEGVNASTSLNFSRIYKTKNPLSSGSFTVNARGVKGIEGQLITQNPFFHPFALMDLQIDITEVDSTGVPLFPGPFAPVVKINPLLRNVDTLGPFAWVGDPGAAGRRTLDIKTNFSGKLKFKKKVNETKFFKIEGVFGVGASISKVDSLADRLTYLDAFFALVEENNPANVLSPQELLANLSLFLEIDGANKGTLTALGAEGFAISDFFGTVDIIVDATDVVPEPSTMLLLGFGLAGLGFMRRRFQYHCHWHSSQ